MVIRPPRRTGRIVYRLDLAAAVAKPTKKKRRRPPHEKEDPSLRLFQTQAPVPGESPTTTAEASPDRCSGLPPLAGWLWVESSSSATAAVGCYWLSVPANLVRSVGDACRYGDTVILHDYVLYPLLWLRHCHGIQKQEPNHYSVVVPTALLEMGAGGITVMAAHEHTHPQRVVVRSEEVWTLEQLARREAVDRRERVGGSSSSSSSCKQTTYCFRAIVAAVSPILSMDPTNPFSLLELYDDQKSDFSCVAVLRKECLVCHAAIAPGNALIFQNVIKQYWRVPDEWVDLAGRVPKSVFVVETALQIHWGTTTASSSSSTTQRNYLEDSLPPIASLKLSHGLFAIEGRIEVVHMMIDSEESKHIHFVELLTLGVNKQKISLFLTYFPMSTSQKLSLRPGAVIRAINVHNIGLFGYCASLRSFVATITHAAVAFDEQMSRTKNTSKRELLLLPFENAAPFTLLRVRRSYPELWCRRLVARVIQDFRLSSFKKQKSVFMLPSQDEFVHSLMGIQRATKHAKRNAYREFFEHGVDSITSSNRGKRGCHASFHTQPSGPCVPLPLSLQYIQERAFDLIEKRIETFTKMNPYSMRIGWTGSISLSEHLLLQSFADDTGLSEGQSMYAVGYGNISSIDGMAYASLSNGHVVLPVVFCMCNNQSFDTDGGDAFVWVRLRCLAMACICIGMVGSTEEEAANERSRNRSTLPPYFDDSTSGSAGCGSCVLIKANGHVFLASLYLVCDGLRFVGSLPDNGNSSAAGHPSFRSVEDCLQSRTCANDASTAVLGLLARASYKVERVKESVYGGCTMAMSHAPAEHTVCSKVSTLQSVDLKPPIVLDGAKRRTLRAAISSFVGEEVTDQQLTLGLVWWKLASLGRTCSLLSGGWDEKAGSLDLARAMGVVVRLPLSSVHRDHKRGYTRFRCQMDDIFASVCWIPKSQSGWDGCYTTRLFDSIGGEKFVAGMIDRRPMRRQFGDISRGELIINPANAGIRRCTLADLFGILCDALRTGSRSRMAPSLVREVQGACLLGITYCRARAECSLCHATLRGPSEASVKKGNKGQDDGVVSSVQVDLDKNVFWPVPVSLEGEREKIYFAQPFSAAMERGRLTTSLRCPNNCRVDLHGAIKWECSGTLDDGTGQARLFAERDAALCLLGMPVSSVEAIEKGAWSSEVGILFSKSMPPKSNIRAAVISARTLATNQLESKGIRGPVQDKDVLPFLTSTTRAEYLLQRHGRLSKEPLRQLTYFIRCKPLSDGIVHLNQTEIEASPFCAVATYSLPSLNLNLVDCCSAMTPWS